MLDGLGCLEQNGFEPETEEIKIQIKEIKETKVAKDAFRSVFNGVFCNNVRQGYASKTQLDDKEQTLWKFEGVYKNDQPNGQGQLTILRPLNKVNKDTIQEFQGSFKNGLLEGFGQVNIEG